MEDAAKTRAWDESYRRRDNFVFWPREEVVRFVARYLRRRLELDEFVDVLPGAAGSRILDVGCGIGHNLAFGTEMGFEMYGIDLSAVAVMTARQWLGRIKECDADARVVTGDVRTLPWPTDYFDHGISDGVLDSMTFDIARAGVAEIGRVIKSGGYFYFSLISGDQTGFDTEFDGEVEVAGTHERGTIQSYFNRMKIDRLLGGRFEILRCELHRFEDRIGGTHHGRWHIVARRP